MVVDVENPAKSYQDRDFDTVLLEAIDDTFAELLGEGVKKALYDYLERNISLKRTDIPGRLNDFRAALEKVAGTASIVMEKSIAKKVYSRLGLNYTDKPGYTLSDFVAEARRNISQAAGP